MVVEDVVDHVLEAEDAGRNHVVAAQGRRHDRCRRGDDARSRKRRHLRRLQNRVERCYQDHGKRRRARDDDREERAEIEDERHEHVGRVDVRERPAHHLDHHGIGADVGHVGGKTEEREDDEARV